MPEGKKSIEEFATGIKSKFPQYKDMDNLELANKMLEKYPQYQNTVDFEVKKKDSSQQDLEEPSVVDTEPSLKTGKAKTEEKVSYYQPVVPLQQDVLKEEIVKPEEVTIKPNSQLQVIKKRIKNKFEDLSIEDSEAVSNQIYKQTFEATKNPYVAEKAKSYFEKLKQDQLLLNTEEPKQELPPEEKQVFDNIKNMENASLLGEDFAEKLPPSDIIPNHKIYNDYSNYLKVTDPQEYNNYKEGRYAGKGEREYNFYLKALGHQAEILNAKLDTEKIDDDIYLANKKELESKFKNALQVFPEYNQELKDRAERQLDIDESYDDALKNINSENYLDRAKASAVIGYYNVVAPAMGAFTNFGVDVISSAGRLSSETYGDDVQRTINNYVDDMDKYFNLESTRSPYTIPTELKGALFDEQKGFQVQKLIPKTSETLAQMSTLLIGGGKAAQTLEAAGMGTKIASNTGLFVSSYMSTQNQYYIDARDQGMSHDEAMAYSNTAASLTSLLELGSPQRYFNNKQITGDMSKNAIKDIIGGTSRTKAITKNFGFVTKEQAKEIGQEISQELGDNATNYVFNNLTDSELKTSTTGEEFAEIVVLTGIVSGIGSAQGIKTSNTLRSESFYNAMRNPDGFDKISALDEVVDQFGKDKLNQAKSDVKEYGEIFDALPNKYNEYDKMKIATNVLDKRRLEQEKQKIESIDEAIAAPEVEKIDKEIDVVNKEMSKNAGIEVGEKKKEGVPTKEEFIANAKKEFEKEFKEEDSAVEELSKLNEQLAEKKYEKLYGTKPKEDDKKDIAGIPSTEQKGEAPIETKPEPTTSKVKTEAGGVLQEKEKVEKSKIDKKEFAKQAILTGQVIQRSEKGNLTEAREDFGMPVKQINAAIQNIKDVESGKKTKYSKPAEQLLSKLEEFYEKGDIPVIEGTGGMTSRTKGIPIDEIVKGIEESKKSTEKPTKEAEMSDEMKDWLDEGEDWEGANIFNHSNIADKIVEWHGDKMPEKDIKKAISTFRENIEAGVSNSQSIANSLDEMRSTDWYLQQSANKQDAFDQDFKKSLGEDIKASEKIKTPEEEKVFIRQDERTILKEKIKNLAAGAKIGAKQKEEALTSVKKELVRYADESLKEFPISKAKQREINNMIAKTNNNTIGNALDKIDKIVQVQEEADRKETVRRVEKLIGDKRTTLKKVGSKWKGKVPIDVQEYIKNFNTSELSSMSRSEIKGVENLLKEILKEGVVEVKGLERAAKAQRRKEEAEVFQNLYEGNIDKVSGQEEIEAKFEEKDKAIVVDGQLIGSKKAFDEFLKDNPYVNLNNISVYDKKTKQLQELNKKGSLKELFNTWIDPTKSKANLTNNLLPLIKGSKVMRQKVEGLIDDINTAYFNMNEDRINKVKDYKENTENIFYKNISSDISKGLIKITGSKSNYATRRLSVHAGIMPQAEMIHPPTNDMVVNWYSLSQTELGLKGLERSKVDVKMVEEYINRPENKDLKEYSEYLLNDFYPSLKDSYEPTYEHITNTKFPDDLIYYPTYSEKTDRTGAIDTEGIMDKDFNVNYMKPIAGNLKQRVKHGNKLNLVVGAHEVAIDYINRMERAKHFIPVGEDVNTMFSKTNIPEIINKVGPQNFNNMMDHLSVVITGISPRKQSVADYQLIRGIQGLRVFGALAFKLASIPKQITSFTHFSTAHGVTLEEWIAGFAPITKNELDVYKKIARSNYVKERFKGRSIDIEANRLLDMGKRSKILRIISKMTRVGMMPISIGDIGGVLVGGRPLALAVYRQAIADGFSHNEAYEKAYRKFVDESESAQQSTRESETSHLQRDNVGRLFTAFTTSQTQTTNKMVAAAKNLMSKSELTPDEQRENLYNLVYYTGANLGFAIVANGFIKELLKGDFEDEENRDALKKGAYDSVLDNTQSILNGFGEHGIIANYIINNLRGDEWKNDIPVLQELSYIGAGAAGILHFWMTNKEWDDLSEAEQNEIWNTIPIGSIRKQAKGFQQYLEGDKELEDAIMNYKSEKEQKSFKPKDDKIYEYLFGESYSGVRRKKTRKKKSKK